jgi:DNA-binding transcriptional ArsR family regulator/uncharacterized protein YndB with AHSA1/START domain
VESETVWRALASPHRRKLLEMLADGRRTTGELARGLPELSRFAAMQHLGVLEEAGLIVVEREGRQRFNHLNPAPIRQLYERWMRSNSSLAAETALHLKRYAETTNEVAQLDQREYRHVQIELELQINAPRQKVFDALTIEYGNWWPHRYKPDSTCYCEPFAGGKLGERFANGGGAIYGEVVYLDAPNLLITAGASSLNKGFQGYSREELIEKDGGTLLKRSMQLWGTVPEEMERMFREGSRQLMEKALKGYLEQGSATLLRRCNHEIIGFRHAGRSGFGRGGAESGAGVGVLGDRSCDSGAGLEGVDDARGASGVSWCRLRYRAATWRAVRVPLRSFTARGAAGRRGEPGSGLRAGEDAVLHLERSAQVS